MQTLIPLLFTLITSVPGLPSKPCDEGQQSIIQNRLTQSSSFKPYIPFELDKTKYQAICSLYNPDMLDGMAYVLFESTDPTKLYIGVYNGLNGSHMLHGPFYK